MLIRGKRDGLADAFFKFKLLHAIHTVQNNFFISLSYHRIRKDDSNRDAPYLFCTDVFGPTETQFNEQMQWIKKYGHPLSQEELIYHLDKRRPLPPRSVMVTFDDAYLDNYTIAYPILRSLNIPAIFFVPTKIISDRTVGWWDLIAYFVKSCKKSTICVWGTTYHLNPNPSERLSLILSLQKIVKHLKQDLTGQFVQDLAIGCEVDFPSIDIQSNELMTWSQIKEVSQSVIQIGSHTHTHRVLSTLSLHEQLRELRESKSILEAQLSFPIDSVAIPVGGYEHFSTETLFLIKESGYKLSYSYLTGINPRMDFDPYDIKRVSVPPSLARFVGLLTIPRLFFEASSPQTEPQSLWRQQCSSAP